MVFSDRGGNDKRSGPSPNTMFMGSFASSNWLSVDFTNTENDRRGGYSLGFVRRVASGAKRHFAYQAGMRQSFGEPSYEIADGINLKKLKKRKEEPMAYRDRVQGEIKKEELRNLWQKICKAYEQGGSEQIKSTLNYQIYEIKKDYKQQLEKLRRML